MQDILFEIVERRKRDIAQEGYGLGSCVPPERERKGVVPFVDRKCAVLEVKRASPSKGDIAPDLDAGATAGMYAAAGAGAVSVLTERHWFKGSLDDLRAVCAAVDEYAERTGSARIAVLRKDFLLSPEEVDVAYRCGADAVLLISRILSTEDMISMARRCEHYGMTAFIELRLPEDVQKFAEVCRNVSPRHLVCGVNSRDLSDFSVDLLMPCRMLPLIRSAAGEDARVIFESGIRSARAASFVGSLGFTGLLLGEAAARNPDNAKDFVGNFLRAETDACGRAWLEYSDFLRQREISSQKRSCAHDRASASKPLVKICGLTRTEDALYAAAGGASFLGFIFWKGTERNADPAVVLEVRKIIDGHFKEPARNTDGSEDPDDAAPKLVGVVVDCTSDESLKAIDLVRSGTLDFLQLHGERAVREFFADESLADLPHYCVVNVSSEADLERFDSLRLLGEPRILVDSKTDGKVGGTGIVISAGLTEKISAKTKLWLAGGISPLNVADIIRDAGPELIDVNSGVESEPGVKDKEKMLALFEAVESV